MKGIYNRYFGKDKALRHYTQHLVIALLMFLIFRFFVFESANVFQVILFFFFTYLIDLDSVITILLSKRNAEFKNEICGMVRRGEFESIMIYATKNHKKIDNLKLHNLPFYGIFSVLLVVSIIFNYVTFGYIFLALVVHMTFDILDDLRNLGHLKHWERIK